MARKVGAPISTTYNPADYKPFDTRQLVTYFSDLINPETWKVKGELYAFNGMIVAVGGHKDSEDSESGVYYLFDAANKDSDMDYPEVSNAANWHKLCELSELDSLAARVATLEGKNPEVDYDALIIELKKTFATLDSFNTYTTIANEAIAALQKSTADNAEAIAALVGSDKDSTVREILDKAVKEVDEKYESIAALTQQVIDNTAAIGALTGTGDQSIGDIAVEAVEAKIVETHPEYSSIAALVQQVSSSASAIAALTEAVEDINVIEEVNAAISDASETKLGSLAALTSQVLDNQTSIQALLGEVPDKVAEELAKLSDLSILIDNSDEIGVDGKKLIIKQLDIKKIIQADKNTKITIYGGSAQN